MGNVGNAVEHIKMLYTAEFRGKKNGRFALTREQMLHILQTSWLHAESVRAINERLVPDGLIVVDMDTLFPVLPRDILQRFRRPPNDLLPIRAKSFAIDSDFAEE